MPCTTACKKALVLAAVVAAGAAATAHGQDMMGGQQGISPQVQVQINRLDERINRVSDQNEQILSDIRELQRQVSGFDKRIKFLESKTSSITDDVAKFRNTDVANLAATDGQLKQMIDDINAHIKKQTPIWDWGTETRDCKEIGSVNQQIQLVKSADGKYTLRYLCLDGRAIHMGTEVNLPPKMPK